MELWRVGMGGLVLVGLILLLGGWVDRWCASRERMVCDRVVYVPWLRRARTLWRG